MISAKDIPHFTGDLEQLEQHAAGLRAHAGALRQAGAATHSRFQGLEAFYEAPEAERLFASTAPVRDRADLFASKVETVAGALDDYAGAVRPIVARLDRLRTRAAAFVASLKTDGGEIDDEWTQDREKVDEHAALWAEIAQAQADFTAAETAANNKITAMVGGTQYVPQGDGVISGPLGARVYGYTAEALEHADKLPWGTPEARTYDTWDYKYHLKDAGVGFKDAFVSTAVGLVDLVSPGAKGDTARKGLGMAVLGLESYLVDPLNQKDGPWNERMAKGRPYAKAFAKGLVGWDDWQDHPGKATGTVIFNGLSLTSGPLGAVAKLAKGGALAKTAGALAKVGEAIDPIGAAAKTVGVTTRAIPKITEVTARVRAGFGDLPQAGSTSSVWKFSTRSELNLVNGKFVHIKDGTPDTTPAPVEPTAHERTPSVAMPREHQLIGAGMRAPEADARAGANLPSQASHDAAVALGRHRDVAPRSSQPEAAAHAGDGVGGAPGRSGDDTGRVSRDIGGTASHHPHGAPGSGTQSHTAGSTDGLVDQDPNFAHGGTDASDGMGTRREYEARVSPESTIAVPPKEASDLVLETGDHVYFGDGATAIGYDQNTVGNFARVQPLKGYHDVVVHGNNRGFFMPGRINEAGVGFPAGDVHPSHITDAIRNNPSYNGGPIRLISCHTGHIRFLSDENTPLTGKGVLHDSAAQAIANELGVPVMAPTDAVGTFSNRGPGQIPRINRNGYWRTFLPISH